MGKSWVSTQMWTSPPEPGFLLPSTSGASIETYEQLKAAKQAKAHTTSTPCARLESRLVALVADVVCHGGGQDGRCLL